MDRKIVEKFFANQATSGETRRVLKWFETPEGKQYLQERLDVDGDLMDREELRNMVPELDSEALFSSIQKNIGKKRNLLSLKRTDVLGYVVKAAATILIITTASLFAISQERYAAEQVVEQEPIILQTQDEQHREINLNDGTVVRLNSNSEIIISENFLRGTREVTLTGEAYFDVAHSPEQPFIIHANQSSVEVLGTSFNVRSIEGQGNVQVAVVEGKVSFRSEKNGTKSEQLSVILSKNQYGYLDLENRAMNVDDLAVENYLAWKSGRFVFEDLTMQQVCTQLNRLYEIQCDFAGKEIKDLMLTANFSNESMEKTLEVIALTLDIKYETNNENVLWHR